MLSTSPESVAAAVEQLRKRLVRYYAHYNPSNLDKVDEILVAYDYDANEVFEDLAQVYGPEPPDDGDLGTTPPAAGDSVRVLPDPISIKTTAPSPTPEQRDPSQEPLTVMPSSDGSQPPPSSTPSMAPENADDRGVSRSVSQRDRLAAERRALQLEREEFAGMLQEQESPPPITERSKAAIAEVEEKRRSLDSMHKQERMHIEEDAMQQHWETSEEEGEARDALRTLFREQRVLAESFAMRREREAEIDRERTERLQRETAIRRAQDEEIQREFAAREAERLKRLEELEAQVRAAEEAAAKRAAASYDDFPDVLVVKGAGAKSNARATDDGINNTPPGRLRLTADDAGSVGGVSALTNSNAGDAALGAKVVRSNTTSVSGDQTAWRQRSSLVAEGALAVDLYDSRPQLTVASNPPKRRKPRRGDWAEGAVPSLDGSDVRGSGRARGRDSYRGDPAADEGVVDEEEEERQGDVDGSASITSSAIRWSRAAGGGFSNSPAPARPIWRGDGVDDANHHTNPFQTPRHQRQNAPQQQVLSPAAQRVAKASYAVYRNGTARVGAAAAHELLARAKTHAVLLQPAHQYSDPAHHDINGTEDSRNHHDNTSETSERNPVLMMFVDETRRVVGDDGDGEVEVHENYDGRRATSVVHHHHKHVIEIVHKGGDEDLSAHVPARSISGDGDGQRVIQKLLQSLSTGNHQLRATDPPEVSRKSISPNEYMFPVNRALAQPLAPSSSRAGGLYLSNEDFERYHYPAQKFTPVAVIEARPSGGRLAPARGGQWNVRSQPTPLPAREHREDVDNAAPQSELPQFYRGEQRRPEVRDARRPMPRVSPHVSELLTQGGRGPSVVGGGIGALRGTPWRGDDNPIDAQEPAPARGLGRLSPVTGRRLRTMEIAAPTEPRDSPRDNYERGYGATRNDGDSRAGYGHERQLRGVHSSRLANQQRHLQSDSYRNGDPSATPTDISRTPSVAETVLEMDGGTRSEAILRCTYEEGHMPPSPFIVASHTIQPPRGASPRPGVGGLTSSSGVGKLYPASYYNDPSRLLEGSAAHEARRVGFNRNAFEYGGPAVITTTVTAVPHAVSNAGSTHGVEVMATQQWVGASGRGPTPATTKGGIHSLNGGSVNARTPTRGGVTGTIISGVSSQRSTNPPMMPPPSTTSQFVAQPSAFTAISTKRTPAAVSGW